MGILREVTLRFIRQRFPSLFNTFHVSLDRGHVDSTDLVLSKSDPISVHSIPWQVLDGKVSGLSLQLPWMSRLGAKFSIKVKSVHVHITEVPFPELQELVFNALNDEMCRKKFRLVAEAERTQALFGSSVRQIMLQVIERIELKVENFRAVVEFADGCTGTFTVTRLLARQPERASTGHRRTLVISIEGISAIIASSSGDVLLKLPDFSISLRIELDDDTFQVNLDVSRRVEVSVHSSLREFIHSLKLRRAQWWSAHQWDRPRSCARTDALSWIRYAYRRVSAAHGLFHVRFDLETLRYALRSFVEYKDLHVKRLSKSRLKNEETSRITELEKSFDCDLILLLRHAAQRDFEADEVSQFGTSEWLRWILFGHQTSSERESLTADVRRSLEQSIDQGTIVDAARRKAGRDQNVREQYAFHCSLNGLSVHVIGTDTRKRELEVSITGLGLSAGLNSTTGHYNVGLLVENLLFSVDGDTIAQEQPLPREGTDGDRKTPQLTATFSKSSDGISASIHLQSMSVMLQPAIIESCSIVYRQCTSPLLPIVFDRQEYQTHGRKGDGQSESLNIFCANVVYVCTITSMHVLLFDDRNMYSEKCPALIASLRQIAIRSPQSRTSSTTEFGCWISLQGTEFDVHSKLMNIRVFEAGESSPASEGQQFFSFSTDFQLGWKPTVTVKLNDTVGFIHVPTAARLMSKLFSSCSSHVVDVVSSECDENDLHSDPEPVFGKPSIQECFVQSGLQFVLSSLRVNILWDSQALNHAFLLEIKQWEAHLSSPTFSPTSMRFGYICLSSSSSSSSTKPFLLLIEPTSGFKHAICMKRGSYPHVNGHFFEVILGDVSSKVSADVVLAVTALVRDMLEKFRSSPRTVRQVLSSKTDGPDSMTLLSLLVTSLTVQWSDGQFHAEISCSDLQMAAEGNQISGSAETVTLSEVKANCDDPSPVHEEILHVTEPLRPVNAAVSFLNEPTGFHLSLSNLTSSAKRSFWGPLISSIANVLKDLEEQHDAEKISNLEVLQNDNRGTPIKIEGSRILLILPISKLGSPEIHADIAQVVVLLKFGLQSLSFQRTAILIHHVDARSHDSWRTRSEESTHILHTASLDIEHKNFTSLQDAEKSVHNSDIWELTASNAVAISVSPKSLLTLQIGLAELLAPCSETEGTSASHRTDMRADNPSAFVRRTRIVCRVLIESLRLSLKFDKGGINEGVFATIAAQEICLSGAEVRDRLNTDNCDIVVLSLLASCRTFHLLKCEPSSPEPWRIVIGRDVRRLSNSVPSHNHQGVSIRFVSRQDHGCYTTTFSVRVSGTSIMHDPGLYVELSRFITECSRGVNAVNQETLSEVKENQSGGHDCHQTGEIAVGSSSMRVPLAPSSTTSGDPRMASSDSSSTKVNITLTNFTFLCPLDEDRDFVCCVRLYIRKTTMALVVSNLSHPMNGSRVRLEGISIQVSANHTATKRNVPSIVEEEKSQSRIYVTQELLNDTLYYTHVPSSMSFSTESGPASLAEDKLVTMVGDLSVTLKRSQEDELVLSVENVSVDTSIHAVLRLGKVISGYSPSSSTSTQSLSYGNFETPSRLRLHIQSATLRLTMERSPSAHWGDATRFQSAMRVDLSISLQSITDLRRQTSQGTLQLSLDVSDYNSGHRDELIFPSELQYRIKKTRGYAVESEIRQPLRISLSPLIMRMVSALTATVQNSDLFASTSNGPLAISEIESKLAIRIHGIMVRCLSDVPRIQVLRLLLKEIRIDTTFTMESGSRSMDFSVRDFLLEDTISWRVFRSDTSDSSSRRWQIVFASVRKQDNVPGPPSLGSPQNLGTNNTRLHTSRVPYNNVKSSIRPALQCHMTWRDYFEDLKARICPFGVDINLDLAAVPVFQEWYNSLVRELSQEDSSRPRIQDRSCDNRESQGVIQQASWFSEIHFEPLSITGSIRAAPRRLEERVYERLLTSILNVDSVTGLYLDLPAIHIRGQQSLTNVRQILFSSSSVTRELIWQLVMQTGRFSRAVRLIALSLFRQRPYNALSVSPEVSDSMRRSGKKASVGLLVALDDVALNRDDSKDAPSTGIVQRVAWHGGTSILPSRRGKVFSSAGVVDLT